MFAIAFDLDTIDTERDQPNGVSQAYRDIERALGRLGFRRVQGSLYVTESQNLLVVTSHPRLPGRTVVGLHRLRKKRPHEPISGPADAMSPPRVLRAKGGAPYGVPAALPSPGARP